MISDLSTYSIENFIMFSYEVYWSMVASYNTELWPYQLIIFAFNIFLFFSILKRKNLKWVLALVGIYHAVIANIFFIQKFALINTASEYIGYLYLLISFLLFSLAFRSQRWKKSHSKITLVLIVVGLFVPFHFFRQFELTHIMLAGWGSLNTSLLTLGVLSSVQDTGKYLKKLISALTLFWILLYFTVAIYLD
ncbi:MAG: hypothetical protein CME62_15550 [Halobacteriovoraceae bacterium]|nr:hypothetical protein [Halobacteriovoraceae bacterium]|tara:strand:- start:10620 stop:11198 length:579 start_codon:yes stop_codon:yes gene_type:complete